MLRPLEQLQRSYCSPFSFGVVVPCVVLLAETGSSESG